MEGDVAREVTFSEHKGCHSGLEPESRCSLRWVADQACPELGEVVRNDSRYSSFVEQRMQVAVFGVVDLAGAFIDLDRHADVVLLESLGKAGLDLRQNGVPGLLLARVA